MESLSAVVPATDGRPTDMCVRAIRAAVDAPEEIVVVDKPHGLAPAAARNEGVERTKGDIIVFVDSDVVVHADAFRSIRAAFARSPDVVAVFGAYDDEPSGGALSDFRNLLHHHVHSSAAGDAKTFWAGIGAVRREAFLAAGGFDERRFAKASIEDIEFGMRLIASGKRIVLDPTIQGKHLKRWTLWTMAKTDLIRRGVPWVHLVLERKTPSTALNLGWRHRTSAVAAASLIGTAATGRTRTSAAVFAGFVCLNGDFYRLLYKRGGVRQVAAGIPLHLVHHLISVAAVPIGVFSYVRTKRRRRRS